MSTTISPDRRSQLAASLGVNDQYLYQCLTGRRDMKPGRARKLEEKSNGELTRQMLCQKTWAEIWPELARPRKPAGQGA